MSLYCPPLYCCTAPTLVPVLLLSLIPYCSHPRPYTALVLTLILLFIPNIYSVSHLYRSCPHLHPCLAFSLILLRALSLPSTLDLVSTCSSTFPGRNASASSLEEYHYYQGHSTVEEYSRGKMCVCWKECFYIDVCTKYADTCQCSDSSNFVSAAAGTWRWFARVSMPAVDRLLELCLLLDLGCRSKK